MRSLPEVAESEQRRRVVEACRRLHAAGLIGGGEGNVSVRLGPRRILATPSGANKALLQEHQLVVTDLRGDKITGRGKPSSELPMHLAAYRTRADVGAVVHAHPPTAVALTLAGVSLEAPLMAEAVTALGGGIPTARYATPSTEEMANEVARPLMHHDAALMERHGAIAVGADVFAALDRMETIERVAQVVLRTLAAGGQPLPLPKEEVDRLLNLSGRTPSKTA
jgi:L-fuculose-phosphate aldolase